MGVVPTRRPIQQLLRQFALEVRNGQTLLCFQPVVQIGTVSINNATPHQSHKQSLLPHHRTIRPMQCPMTCQRGIILVHNPCMVAILGMYIRLMHGIYATHILPQVLIKKAARTDQRLRPRSSPGVMDQCQWLLVHVGTCINLVVQIWTVHFHVLHLHPGRHYHICLWILL